MGKIIESASLRLRLFVVFTIFAFWSLINPSEARRLIDLAQDAKAREDKIKILEQFRSQYRNRKNL